MEKLNKIFILILLSCFLSCNTKYDTVLNQKLIKNISEEDKNYPSRFFNVLFFCKCKSDEISILSIYEIREVYLKEFNHIKYKDFLTELFNQSLLINCDTQGKKFWINEIVKKNYLKMPINEFLNFYCTKKSDNLFSLKNEIADEYKNTILYFLFLNNYLANIDDYSGTYIIKKAL
jgi:hypothetical protein